MGTIAFNCHTQVKQKKLFDIKKYENTVFTWGGCFQLIAAV